jgi:hypothetical protein
MSRYTGAVSKQRLGTHVPSATDTHATIQVFFETAFSARSLQKGYKEDNCSKNISVGREPPFRENLSTEAEE